MRRLTRRQRMAAIVLAVVALCFITLDLGGGSLQGAHSGVRGALGSLYRGTDTVLGPVRRWFTGRARRRDERRPRSQQLQHQNARAARRSSRADAPTARHRRSWPGCSAPPTAATTRCCRPGSSPSVRARASTGR